MYIHKGLQMHNIGRFCMKTNGIVSYLVILKTKLLLACPIIISVSLFDTTASFAEQAL